MNKDVIFFISVIHCFKQYNPFFLEAYLSENFLYDISERARLKTIGSDPQQWTRDNFMGNYRVAKC